MASHSLRGFRVLVAEDQMIVAMEIEDILREVGCEVIGPASTLEFAISLAADTTPDAAILDVNLDGTQIYPLAEQLRARGIPVILATGYGTSTLPEAWRRVPRLNKPFTRAQLKALLGSVIENAGKDQRSSS